MSNDSEGGQKTIDANLNHHCKEKKDETKPGTQRTQLILYRDKVWMKVTRRGIETNEGHTGDLLLLIIFLPLSFYLAFFLGNSYPHEKEHRLLSYALVYSYYDYTEDTRGISSTFFSS